MRLRPYWKRTSEIMLTRHQVASTSDVAGEGKYSSVLHRASLVCLFCFGANMLGVGHLFLLMAMMLSALRAPRQLGRIPLDLNLLMLLVFWLTYSLQESATAGKFLLNSLYLVAYMVGFLYVTGKADPYSQFRSVVLTLTAGTTLHGSLNAITNLRAFGWTPGERVLPDFWSQAPLTATLQATLFIPLVGFACYGLAMRQPHRAIVVMLTGSSLILAGAYNLATASRTIFVVMLLTLIACTLVPPGRRILRVMILAGLGVGVQRLYMLDVFSLRSLVEGSALMERVSNGEAPGFGEDPRFERWVFVIQNFWDHVGGGLHFRAEIGYVHNLWLDVYDAAGLPAFLSLVGFTFGGLVLLWRILVIDTIPVALKVLMVGLWVALLAQFMTEPILDGMPMLFAVFCVFSGAAAALAQEPGGVA